MAQFGDSGDDYYLLSVVERLSPEDLSKLHQVMAITFDNLRISDESRNHLANCFHLRYEAISPDQVLSLNFMLKRLACGSLNLNGARFPEVMSKCFNVKSFDFSRFTQTEEFLLKVADCCPQLECIKIRESNVDDKWNVFLDRIGGQIVHFVKKLYSSTTQEADVAFLKMIAEKCPNIKQIDWCTNYHLDNGSLNDDIIGAFRLLPKRCWISLDCHYSTIPEEVFDHIFDELSVSAFNCKWVKENRLNRLESLKLRTVKLSWERLNQVRGVEFARLKKLDVSQADIHDGTEVFRFLVASQLPQLKEFVFNPESFRHASLTEDRMDVQDVYEIMFQQMTTVKKLTIVLNVRQPPQSRQADVLMPGTVIHQLNNLETIHLDVRRVPEEWQPEEFLQQVEQYVDGISSLKKLIVSLYNCRYEWAKKIEDEVNRMKANQSEVEVDLVHENEFDLMN